MRPENTKVWRKGLRKCRHGNRSCATAEDKTILADIENRWLEREADFQTRLAYLAEHRGIDPDLELAALANPGITVILLRDDPA